MNQVVEAYLRIYCGNWLNKWINYITNMEFAHNQHIVMLMGYLRAATGEGAVWRKTGQKRRVQGGLSLC